MTAAGEPYLPEGYTVELSDGFYCVVQAEPQPGQTYTITFDPNGDAWEGSGEPITDVTDSGGLLDASGIPAEPVWANHVFRGWYTSAEGGEAVDLTAGFTGDTTLYAQWTAMYTITFNPNGGGWSGSTGPKTVLTGADGLLAERPAAPTRSGYTFGGWYTNAYGGEAVNLSAVCHRLRPLEPGPDPLHRHRAGGPGAL